MPNTSDDHVPRADRPLPRPEYCTTAAELENHILRDEIERLTKELFAAKSTRLPQRKPLTDEEIRELSQQHKFHERMEKFVRIVEQAHGIGDKYEY